MRHDDGPVLILAGAGSGKTRVVSHKVLHLLGNRAVDPRQVVAVTFTNKAAREMNARLGATLGQEAMRHLRVSTFHRFGLNFLRRHAEIVGLRNPFSIIDGADSALIVAELMRQDLGGDRGVIERVRQKISWWKNDLVDAVETASRKHDDAVAESAARIYGDYNRQLRACNAVDLDDLVLLPVKTLSKQSDLYSEWHQQRRYILVDEYQDTNNAQYELVRLLAGDGRGLTVVGDDDQSIYSWRGARPENLARLETDFAGLEVIKLEQNYRSTGRILHVANALITNNPRSFEKKLWSEVGYGPPVRVMIAGDEEREAEQIASNILHHKFQKRSRFSDYAILYRGNHQSREFEQKLREMRIPYEVSGELSFFDRREIKDVLAYLRLVVNHDDDTAFMRIVNAPRRGIGPVALERLGNVAASEGRGLLHAIAAERSSTELTPRQLAPLSLFADWVAEIGRRIPAERPADLIDEILTEIDYRSWLQESAGSPEQGEQRQSNVKDLTDWVKRMQRNEPAADLADIVSHMALIGKLDREQEENGDVVSMMTLHAAKGLEFPYVYIAGLEEELLPHQNSLDDDGEHEERRLFYVGITRAMQELTLSWCRTRKRQGQQVERTPSRFLDELPQDALEWHDAGRINDSVGQAHIDNIRALLN